MVEIPNLNIELNEIPNLSYAKLRDLYFYLFNQYIKSTRREFFVWRITNRLQELRYGGLDSKTRRFLENMTEDDIPDKPLPRGTEIVKKYKGEIYRLRIISGGFEMKGEVYKSLSAAAYKITGRRVSGKSFFGV